MFYDIKIHTETKQHKQHRTVVNIQAFTTLTNAVSVLCGLNLDWKKTKHVMFLKEMKSDLHTFWLFHF